MVHVKPVYKPTTVLLSWQLFSLCRYLVLTTSSGIMDHEAARRKHTGGKILGFFY